MRNILRKGYEYKNFILKLKVRLILCKCYRNIHFGDDQSGNNIVI